MKKRRVLHVLGAMNRGGAETMIMNVYRNIDRDKVQFDFAVHSFEKCDFDDEIIELGGFIYHYPRYKIKNHFQFLKFWKSFLQTHQEFSYIHCHTMNTAGIIMNLAKKYEIKRIIHSHTNSSGTGYLKYIKDFYRYPLKKMKLPILDLLVVKKRENIYMELKISLSLPTQYLRISLYSNKKLERN